MRLSCFLAAYRLEWQVICTALASCGISSRSWRERSCRTTGRSSCRSRSHARSWWEWSGTRLHTTHGSNGIRINVGNIPRTDIVEPTTLILMSSNVERYIYLITTLYVELSNAISAKYIKHHLLGILLMRLDNVRLRLPLSSSRNTASFR